MHDIRYVCNVLNSLRPPKQVTYSRYFVVKISSDIVILHNIWYLS